MVALLAAVAIFTFFGVVGYALVILTVGRLDEMLTLLSPAIGAAAIALQTMFLNYLGVPVKSFGFLLAAVSLLASLAIIIRSKNRAFPRSLYPIASVLLCGLLLSGWPILEFGFDWLSYANGDMNTYVNGAARMFQHGFLVFPDVRAYVENRETIQDLYSLDVLYNNRSGVENLLAFVMALSHLDGYQAFMPLMLAFHLTLVAAGTALAYTGSTSSDVPLATCVLLSASALVTLGTEYQLLGQVAGLALMAASLVLLCSPESPRPLGRFLRRCCLCAVPVAALGAIYPEIMPFLALAVISFFVFRIVTKTINAAQAFQWLASVAGLVIVFLNFHFSTFLNMLSLSLSFGGSGGIAAAAASFPAYLVPSGLANLFGIAAISQALPEPWQSLGITAGLALLAVVIFCTSVRVLRYDVASFGTLSLLLGGALLAYNRNGFGLYKLAMYAQPFIIPMLVTWWRNIPAPFASPK